MKKLLLFLLLSALSSGTFAQWVWVSQATGFATPSVGVRNISAVNASTAWIATYDGSGGGANTTDFSRTIDGGATWVPGTVPAPASYNWSMINAIDSLTAWAMFYDGVVNAGGGIWKTTDGGANWVQQGAGMIFNASSFPNVVHFWNANEGMAMGDPNPTGFEIYTTTDGGTTWTPAASPAILSGEYGIVDHYSVIGNNIWFDTNKGRVYHSADKGLTWTVASTGITVPANGAINICFYSATNGIARLYDGASGVNTSVKTTSDGGNTWNTAIITGDFFGSDVDYVPGTASRLVSTGAAPGFIGSSYSDDGGLNWITVETAAQRTALGIVDSGTMWAGGFSVDPANGGIFRSAPPVACSDTAISPGISVANGDSICFGDTLMLTTTGALAPSEGSVFGFSIIVSTADISGNNDPLNQPVGVILGGTGTLSPAPDPSLVTLLNDGAIFTAGTYYLTPVVYGNAIGDPTNVTLLTLDPNCTHTGASVMVTLLTDVRPPLAVTSNSPLLCDSLNMTINLSANFVSGVTYSWTGPNGFMSSLQNPSITNATPADSGWYYITLITSNGICNASDSVLFVVDTLPHAYVTTNGASTFCAGDSVTLTASAGTAYLWSPNNETTQSIIVTAAGTYMSTVTDPHGCPGVATSAPLTVTVNPNPAIPVITQVNDSIINTVSGSSYQWYLNGALVPSKTTQSIKILPSQNGSWQVVVTNSFNCSSASNTLQTNVGINELINLSAFNIYPNPGSGVFTVEIKSKSNEHALLQILDLTGRVVYEEKSPREKFTLNMTEQAKGIYYLVLNSGNETISRKLVIK